MNEQEQYFLIQKHDPEGRYATVKLSNREQSQIGRQLHFTDPVKAQCKDPIEYDFMKQYPRQSLMADYHFSGAPDVYSNRLREVIESMNVPDVDFIDAEITDRKGETFDEYSIMHVRRLIACFDKERSRWKPPGFDPNAVMSIDNMVLDMDRLEKIPLRERLIFRLEECVHYHLFHESVVDAIAVLDPAPTGFRFVSVGAWHSDIGWELNG
jgi:hypothetical protein